jgi:RimJ/RimL family protein N-acetyltransferase
MKYARERLDTHRIVAIVSPGNVRPVALLEKLGFYFETSLPTSADNEIEKRIRRLIRCAVLVER